MTGDSRRRPTQAEVPQDGYLERRPVLAEEVERANATGLVPVVLIHGMWLLPSSWDRWAEVFEAADYPVLAVGWPDDPDTVAEAKAHPEVFAGKTVGRLAEHYPS